MKNKQKLFKALDELYLISADPIKPEDKDAWKEETWERLQNKTDAEFDDYVQTIFDIASIKN